MVKEAVIKIAIFLLLVIVLIYFNFHRIMVSYAKFFTVDDAFKGADIILKLGGEVKNRTLLTIKLYNDGFAKKLLISEPKNYIDEYVDIFPYELDMAKRLLELKKTPYEVLASLKGGSTSTFDEAQDLSYYIKNRPNIKKVIIVTSMFHTRRAKMAFEKVFAKNDISHIKVQMAPAYGMEFNESNWYKSERGLLTYFVESLKFVYYLFSSKNLSSIKEY